MRSLFIPLVLTLPMALLTNCSDANEKGGGNNPLATVSGFCQEWAVVVCNEEVVEYCQADDADACQSAQSDFCEDLVSNSGYDPTDAKDCLRAVEDAYADSDLTPAELVLVRALGGECAGLVRGDGDEGDDCSSDSDCNTGAGLTCVLRGAEGTCQEAEEVSAGRSCSSEAAVCEDGFYCNGSNCLERLGEDSACEHSSMCASDLRCVSSASGEGGAGSSESGEGTCVPKAALRAECMAHEDCASGFCTLEDGTLPGRCEGTIRITSESWVCGDLGGPE